MNFKSTKMTETFQYRWITFLSKSNKQIHNRVFYIWPFTFRTFIEKFSFLNVFWTDKKSEKNERFLKCLFWQIVLRIFGYFTSDFTKIFNSSNVCFIYDKIRTLVCLKYGKWQVFSPTFLQVIRGQVFDGPEVQRGAIARPLPTTRTDATSGRTRSLRFEHFSPQRRTSHRKIHSLVEQVRSFPGNQSYSNKK